MLHGIFDFTSCLFKNVEWLVCSILGDVTALVRDVLGSVLHELCVRHEKDKRLLPHLLRTPQHHGPPMR